MNAILKLDEQISVFINSQHCEIPDFIMKWLSDKFIWLPLYLFLAAMIIWKYKKNSIIILAGVVLLILLVDQTTVHLFKNVFHRLRPWFEPALDGILRFHKGEPTGNHQYGFISSHAANTFALATFVSYYLRKVFKNKTLINMLFVWAALVGYSRIYLGAHYFGDVVCGSIWGVMMGMLLIYLCNLGLKHIKLGKPKH